MLRANTPGPSIIRSRRGLAYPCASAPWMTTLEAAPSFAFFARVATNLSPWNFWSADAVEGHVPRTLALGSIVPILDQERQGCASPRIHHTLIFTVILTDRVRHVWRPLFEHRRILTPVCGASLPSCTEI